ncbi:hypothetical protein DESHY_50021 [Desulforamulus hydrothermalis Lam5 = DSM 18033]|uniref:Uncharacterized protein n=1 Tax=Desulforamulus hydrothermalis Lam5 = DSM 18033 TaxID=1121428 RepID=K8EAP2_9FIRM|nr:hypothetical protein DESHY_50021 [Desulforamulus hydrothermalis Lam5 = DSM 18033]
MGQRRTLTPGFNLVNVIHLPVLLIHFIAKNKMVQLTMFYLFTIIFKQP